MSKHIYYIISNYSVGGLYFSIELYNMLQESATRLRSIISCGVFPRNVFYVHLKARNDSNELKYIILRYLAKNILTATSTFCWGVFLLHSQKNENKQRKFCFLRCFMIHPLLLQNLILKESIISNDQLKFS